MGVSPSRRKDLKDANRKAAEGSLRAFISLVHPQRLLGHIHEEVCDWWTRPERKSHQLLLLPRDHQKSALIAYRVAWEITKNPDIRVIYLSATANLAEKQLSFIKGILTSPTYTYYWPEMVNPVESRRTKWSEREISVDHPYRKEQIVRDPTIFTAGLTATITGLHCDIAVLDDIVVADNALTQEGRRKVALQASYISSILGGDGQAWVVGTFYHPKDLYHDMIETTYDVFNEEDGSIIGREDLYEVMKHQVEARGDGTGEFLWPKQKRPSDGKEFGFDMLTLSKKKAQYNDYTQFRAQYYNDPNDMASAAIKPEMFQYYNREHLRQDMQRWYYKNVPLNIVATVDFAFTMGVKSDYTSIIVVGVDPDYNYYVLDIDRFKTDQISVYYDHIARLHYKWDFKNLKAEITSGQKPIVEALKNDYIRRKGLVLTVEGYSYNSHDGTKLERIASSLVPRYTNKQMWHYKGGNCQALEEELVLQRPSHDDIKDVLATSIMGLEPPSRRVARRKAPVTMQALQGPRKKFGGFG